MNSYERDFVPVLWRDIVRETFENLMPKWKQDLPKHIADDQRKPEITFERKEGKMEPNRDSKATSSMD